MIRARDACECDDNSNSCHDRAHGSETIQLYAAGSLKAALTDVSKAYETSTGSKVEANMDRPAC